MLQVKVCKAQGHVEPVSITVDRDFPEEIFEHAEGWRQRASEFYTSEGKKLADALYDSLPGGTMDRLILELLTRRASLLSIPFSSN